MEDLVYGGGTPWTGEIWLLIAASDGLIAAAYLSITLALGVLIYRRPDLNSGLLFWLFAVFFVSTGISHVVSAATFGQPDPLTEGVVKLICAVVAMATAIVLWPIVRNALRMPSIRQMKDTNDQLAAANRELQRKADENRRLALEAQQSERSQEEFVAMVSHEVRTPLNAVLGMSSLLLETRNVSPEQEDYLQTIRSSGESLNALVGNLLDYTKMNSQEIQLQTEPCQIVEVISSTLDILASPIESAGLEFGIKIDPGLPRWVNLDAARFQQVILNLVRNATKFTEKGEIVVGLRSENRKDGRIDLITSVTDTGIGMDAKQQADLFKPFFQVKRSPQRRYEGVGLGLAIVKRICELMGGTVSVQSRENEGSTFTVRIPLEPALRESAQIEQRILIVSRRRLVLETARNQLSHFGADVSVADTVDKALLLIPKTDWILVDYALGSDAEEIAQYSGERKCFLIGPLDRRRLRVNESKFNATFSYPLHLQPFLNDGSRSAPVSAEPPLAESHPLRILVAEDNRANQKVLLLLLKRMGYEADVVANGAAAVEAWKASNYDLILMDVHMPIMDGISACRTIRESETQERRFRCTIAALTADVLSDTIDLCTGVGMDAVLTKPLKPVELQKLLRGTPGRHRVAGAVREEADDTDEESAYGASEEQSDSAAGEGAEDSNRASWD